MLLHSYRCPPVVEGIATSSHCYRSFICPTSKLTISTAADCEMPSTPGGATTEEQGREGFKERTNDKKEENKERKKETQKQRNKETKKKKKETTKQTNKHNERKKQRKTKMVAPLWC